MQICLNRIRGRNEAKGKMFAILQRESNIPVMAKADGFEPNLLEENASYLEFLMPGVEYPAGSTFGLARVVSNDGQIVKLCYEYSEDHCARCVEECPFSKNPSRKEG